MSSLLALIEKGEGMQMPEPPTSRDPVRGQRQAGSLTGAVHLSKGNAGVLRPAQ